MDSFNTLLKKYERLTALKNEFDNYACKDVIMQGFFEVTNNNQLYNASKEGNLYPVFEIEILLSPLKEYFISKGYVKKELQRLLYEFRKYYDILTPDKIKMTEYAISDVFLEMTKDFFAKRSSSDSCQQDDYSNFVSDQRKAIYPNITDNPLEEINWLNNNSINDNKDPLEKWLKRPLEETYPVIFIGTIQVHFWGVIYNNYKGVVGDTIKPAIVISGINCNGICEVINVLPIDKEQPKWDSVLHDMKVRGAKDITIINGEPLYGLEEAIQKEYPDAHFQVSLNHMLRSTLEKINYMDRNVFFDDLRRTYMAPIEKYRKKALEVLAEKWESTYPDEIKQWFDNMNSMEMIFIFRPKDRTALFYSTELEHLDTIFKHTDFGNSSTITKEKWKDIVLLIIEESQKRIKPNLSWERLQKELLTIYDEQTPDKE